MSRPQSIPPQPNHVVGHLVALSAQGAGEARRAVPLANHLVAPLAKPQTHTARRYGSAACQRRHQVVGHRHHQAKNHISHKENHVF